MLCICRAKYAPENLVSFPQKNIRTLEFCYQLQIFFPLQLLDARQLIDKNHIVIERDKVDKVTNQHINFTFANFSYSTWRRWHFSMNNATFFDPTGMITFAKLSYFFFQGPTKCRSISLVCPPTPTSTADERRISLVKQVKFSWNHVFFLDISSCMKRRICS